MSTEKEEDPVQNENESHQENSADEQESTTAEPVTSSRVLSIAGRSEEIKRKGFYTAIETEKNLLPELIEETNTWHQGQLTEHERAFHKRIEQINIRLDEIEDGIASQKERFDREDEFEAELIDEHQNLIKELDELEAHHDRLTAELDDLHTSALKNRLKEIKEELSAITAFHNDIFNERIANEPNIVKAKTKRVELCNDLIDKEKSVLDAVSDQLKNMFSFGTSKLSALFLVSVGMGATTGAGWFFAIFIEKNAIDNENWLFFILTNIFELISITVNSYGAFWGSLTIIGWFLLILGFISGSIYLCEYFLYKVSDDRPEMKLSLTIDKPKSKFLASLKIKGSTLLSFWLQIVPWILMFGLLFIIVAIGNSINTNGEKIEELSNHLSGQIIGSTLTLVTTGVFFLFIVKIIEPRKLKNRENSNENNQTNKKSKRGLLFLFVILTNAVLLLVLIGQAFDNFYLSRGALVSMLLFLLLLNISALTLSYGLRQLGLFKRQKLGEEKLFFLGRYLEVLSSSKPSMAFLDEEEQFTNHFLIMRRELFELMNNKSKSLNQAERVEQDQAELHKTDQADGRTIWRIRMPRFRRNKRNNKKRIQTYYKNNFPGLSARIDEQRDKIRECKANIKDTKSYILHMRTKQSIFHSTIFDEISKLRGIRKNFVKKREKIDLERIELLRAHEVNRKREIHYLIEGYELGTWMKKVIINGTYETTINDEINRRK